MGSTFKKDRKERALFMFDAYIEIYKENRKREYSPYEVSKEETKEYQKKRSKLMNYGSQYDREGNLVVNDQNEFDKEIERIEKELMIKLITL